ncbi:MAG: hypothetical protein KKF44_07435 [Nanoarchaeota archaeon]|nr:hypothetical protein [Nanoarchaeota archaeon]
MPNSIIEKTKTGIRGFDKHTHGGFIKNSVNLVSGGPGTGKSIFALEYLFYGAVNNEPGLFISFEEDLEGLRIDGAVFGWDFKKAEDKKLIKFAYVYPYELSKFPAQLKSMAKSIGAKRIVIDSISNFGMAYESSFEYRKKLYVLISTLKKLEATTILTSEIESDTSTDRNGGNSLSRYGVAEFVCDSVTVLHYGGLGGISDRAVRIMKMRRTDQTRGPIPMVIGPKGIELLEKEF